MRAPDAQTPLTDWLASYIGWPAALLALVALAAVTGWVLARAWRATGRTLDNAPREVRTSWAPEIEDRSLPWTEVDDAAWADYLSDMPYDQEADQ